MSGAHLSIGEVLGLLQEEFPDVTISKIRFLESQGLIQPERTAAGYRKFYAEDIDRLRWVLRQQRDHFLPLKVIRKMLEEGVDRYDPAGGEQPTLFTPLAEPEPDDDGDDGEGDPAPDAEHAGHANADALDRGEEPAANGAAPTVERKEGAAPARPPRSPAHPAVASAPPRPQPAPARAAASSSAAGAGGADPEPHRSGRPAASGAPGGGPSGRGEAGSTPRGGTPRDAGSGGRPAGSGPGRGSARPGRGGPAAGDAAASGPGGPERDGGDREHSGRSERAERGRGSDAGEAGRSARRRGRTHETPADVVAALQEDPRSRRNRPGRPASEDAAPPAGAAGDEATAGAPEEGGRPAPGSMPTGATTTPATLGDDEPVELTAVELCEATGLTVEDLAGLERFGLIASQDRAGETTFDGEALAVARLAARYAQLGVEPRHLRMYLVSAEREAGFVEQLVTPLLKQRNPESRSQAGDLADELAGLGAELHARLLRRELRPGLGR